MEPIAISPRSQLWSLAPSFWGIALDCQPLIDLPSCQKIQPTMIDCSIMAIIAQRLGDAKYFFQVSSAEEPSLNLRFTVSGHSKKIGVMKNERRCSNA
jgi:hypothetical protein